MKVWARYPVAVMVLVDEDEDEIERVVMVPGERVIDRETIGDMLFYTEQLGRMSSSRQEAAHALYVGDHERWPHSPEWDIAESWDTLSMIVDERRHPNRPPTATARDTRGRRTPATKTTAIRARAAQATASSTRDLGRHPDAPVADAR